MNQRSDFKAFLVYFLFKKIRKIFFKGLKFPIVLFVAHITHWMQASTYI
jgi:hypothetical protein